MKRCTSVDLQERISGTTNSKYNAGIFKDTSDMEADEFVNFGRGSTTVVGADRYDEHVDKVTKSNLASQSAFDSPQSLGCPRGDDYSTDPGSEHVSEDKYETAFLFF